MNIKIKVKPKNTEQKIKEINPCEFLVNLKSDARNNKANLEIKKPCVLPHTKDSGIP